MNTKKGKIIAIAVGAGIVAVGIIVAVVLSGNSYRSIVVDKVNGQVNITGEKNNGNAYQGEKLYSGDNVDVGASSDMVMCMDLDKYIYADADTKFGIEASSAKDDSRMKIVLKADSELNELKSKLGPNDSYEVDTPNSTMSVRGTTFRCTVYSKDGLVYTLLEVKEGDVLAKLKTEDGTYNGVEAHFTAGQSAIIRGNSEFSEFVVGEEDEIVLILNYEVLPKVAMDRLIELLTYLEDNMIVGDVEAQEPSVDAQNEVSNNDTVSDSDANADNGQNDADTTNEVAEEESNALTPPTEAPKHVHTPSGWLSLIHI